MAEHARSPHRVIETERLILRRLKPDDTEALMRIAGQRRIADTTISVPHPFTAENAAQWLRRDTHDHGDRYGFGIFGRAPGGALLGYVAIAHIDAEHREGELSFWIDGGKEGRGYVSEAAGAAIGFAFADLDLNRLCAYHMVRNTGSERVLEKLGFRREGVLRERVRKWDRYEDVRVWSLLKRDLR